MTDSADVRTTRIPPRVEGHSRPRTGVALAAAGALCVLIIVGTLPAIYGLPLIGLLIAWGAHRDEVPGARFLSPSSRNLVIGSLVLAAFAVVALQHRLLRLLIVMFGTDLYFLVGIESRGSRHARNERSARRPKGVPTRPSGRMS